MAKVIHKMYQELCNRINNGKNNFRVKTNFIKININKITIVDIQIKDKDGDTILHYLCKNKMHESIKLLIETLKLKPEHFQNKNKKGETELSWLCYSKMHETIALVSRNFVDGLNEDKVFDNVQSTFWKPEHFQNKSTTGRTELYWLCWNKMHSTIALVTSNFVDGFNKDKVFNNVQRTFWKPEHFQNKSTTGQTELHWLCYNEMHETIALITSNFVGANKNKVANKRPCIFWKSKHFQNKNEDGETELYWLCKYMMHKTIALITINFVNGDRWKLEYCDSITERKYMKSIDAFVIEPVIEKKEEPVIEKKEELVPEKKEELVPEKKEELVPEKKVKAYNSLEDYIRIMNIIDEFNKKSGATITTKITFN